MVLWRFSISTEFWICVFALLSQKPSPLSTRDVGAVPTSWLLLSASVHITWTLKLKQLQGMWLLWVLLFTPVLFLLWPVKALRVLKVTELVGLHTWLVIHACWTTWLSLRPLLEVLHSWAVNIVSALLVHSWFPLPFMRPPPLASPVLSIITQ